MLAAEVGQKKTVGALLQATIERAEFEMSNVPFFLTFTATERALLEEAAHEARCSRAEVLRRGLLLVAQEQARAVVKTEPHGAGSSPATANHGRSAPPAEVPA